MPAHDDGATRSGAGVRKPAREASDILEARRIGRSAEERCKILDGADVALLGLRR